MTTTEHRRLHSDDRWKQWGPYLSERAWGTVREDYSAGGTAWDHLPHDHARSAAYRWNEDGLAGICDDRQILCFALSLWNGNDPILKERIFGLTGNQGNHGEDAKEYWWYADSTPTHSYMRWRYVYPQRAFPYGDLVEENARRGRDEHEYELVDSGIFDEDRYFDVTVDYAKASPADICIRVAVRNQGPDEHELHVLPTLWFRNSWSWTGDDRRPRLMAKDGAIIAEHHELGRMVLSAAGDPCLLFCENETNARRLWGTDGTPFPKDGIGDHVIDGAATVNPGGVGTKAAAWYRATIPAGGTVEFYLRLAQDGPAPTTDVPTICSVREAEADEFYASITPAGTSGDDALILRQALAGMLWAKQYYALDVDTWLDGDPGQPPPPSSRRSGRNAEWRHLRCADVISMPDPWEYPWFAAWDLAFHCIPLAHVDPQFAKDQLLLLCREWYMHPNGQLPAYEWAFSDVNPPVHAWAALRVFEIDGGTDYEFLERILHKLLLNFTWWVNRKDAEGNNVFEGGFLGMDNIGPIDRSAGLPVDGHLEQSDGTAWMAMYCLNLLEMSLELANHDPAYEDLTVKFLEHFAYIASAMYEQELWDEEDGFYYDVLHDHGNGQRHPLRVKSMVGLIPLYASMTLGRATLERLPMFAGRFASFVTERPRYAEVIGHVHTVGVHEGRMLSIVDPQRLRRILQTMLDEAEFLGPHGLRSLSAAHRGRPFVLRVAGTEASVDYQPAESTTSLFGGNSNWRGPVWWPVNYLVIESLRRYARFLGTDVTVPMPTEGGQPATIDEVADELSERLISTFRIAPDGRRPALPAARQFGGPWRDRLLFNEYFHGDNGAGLGASHQTGWTGLVADLIIRRSPGTPDRDAQPARPAQGSSK